MQRTRRDPLEYDTGSAMIQWCVAALALVLTGILAIEVSNWHLLRQRLALIGQRTVDSASLSQGTTKALKQHMQLNLPAQWPTQIKACLTDHVQALMADFCDWRLSRELGYRAIRHDHIEAQHHRALRSGLVNGRGTHSGLTISQANILNVEFSATYIPQNPWVRRLIQHVPIKTHHRAIMQSHRQLSQQQCVTVRPDR